MSQSKSLVIINAEADSAIIVEFRKRLAPLESNGQLYLWDSGNILPGADRMEAIQKALQRADMIAFWISPDLWHNNLEFDFVCNHVGLIQPLAQVVPIVARHATWEVLPSLKKYTHNALPLNKQPMPIGNKGQEDAWLDEVASSVAQRLGLLEKKTVIKQSFWSRVTPDGRLGGFISILAIIVGAILAGPSYCGQNEEAAKQKPVTELDPCLEFPQRFVRDTLYVLITRFEDFEKQIAQCYGETMRWHIYSLAKNRHLPIQVCYQNSLSPKNDREADRLLDEYHADLIIWGKLDNVGPDCTSDGFCLLFNPSDTLIRYVGGIPHKTDPSDFQKGISNSQILKGEFRMGKKVFDSWLIDMFNLKIGKKQPALMVIEEGWEASEKLEAYRTRANIWSGLGRHKESIADWDQAIKISPMEALLYNNRGGEKFNLGHFEEAIADYDRAIEVDPNFLFAYLNRGVAKLRSKNHSAEALHDLEHVAGEAPNFPNIYHVKGDAKLKLHRYSEAIEDYEQALKSNPQDIRSNLNRAVAHKELGHWDEAIADYDRVIKISPNHAVAHLNRGAAKARKGLLKEAIIDYNQAIKLNPKDAVAYNNRGGVRYDLGEFEKAIADYDQAIKISPNFEAAIQGRKASLRKLGRYQPAVTDYDEAIKKDSLNSLAYNNRGGAKYNARRYAEAIADYSQAIKLNPKFAAAYSNRATAKSSLGDDEGALADLDQSIKLDSTCVPCYLNRGNIKSGLADRTQEALSDYNRLVSLKPKDPASYLTRGDFWYNRQNYNKAVEDYNRVLEINSELLDVYRKRSIANRKSGRPLSAFFDYCHATWLDPSTRWQYYLLLILSIYLWKFKTINRLLHHLYSRFVRSYMKPNSASRHVTPPTGLRKPKKPTGR